MLLDVTVPSVSVIPHWSTHLPDGDADNDVFVLPEPGTLVGAWSRSLSPNPERVLFFGPEAGGRHSDGETGWITRGGFLDRTAWVAGCLSGAGLQHGDRVLLSGPSSVNLAVAHVACLRLGLVVVPVNGAYQEAELAHVVSDCAPRAAIVDYEDWHHTLRRLNPDLVVASTELEGLVDGHSARLRLDVAAPEDPALIGYTSGTTGVPKGAVHTQASLLAGAESVRLAWRWTEDDRLLLCLPLFHMHGLGVGLHGTLLAGGSAVLQTDFDPAAVIDGLNDHAVTLFFGVPTMYHRLVDHDGVASLGRLRLCVAGSAPLAADLHRRLFEVAGVKVLERYGMTETVMLVSNPYDGERRPGSVGLPLPGIDILIDQATSEILVRGPSLFSGYWGKPEETADAFTQDQNGGPAWFGTGDLGAVDTDGYLSIVGRARELIITGGLNVYPREVDDVLALHPAVGEVAVSGVFSDEWGEEVVAWVVPVEGHDCPTVDTLREFAGRYLAAYKLPRRVVVQDALPRNALGKLTRHQLRLPS